MSTNLLSPSNQSGFSPQQQSMSAHTTPTTGRRMTLGSSHQGMLLPPVAPSATSPSPMPISSSGIKRFFTVMCTGQIVSSMFPEHENLYCKFSFTHGPDWIMLAGVEEGITQLARASQSVSFTSGEGAPCVWNFPLEIAFKASNAHGWPQLVLAVYGLDSLGRDVVRGYGSVRLPTSPGRYVKYVPMFAPKATSPFNQWFSWLIGRPPEFLDTSFPAKNNGRDVTRVESRGVVKVEFNITTRDMEAFGYVNDPFSAMRLSLSVMR